ncbi:MAG: hypothetical protein J0653_03885, partial [Deltaproteobacteria bacterium]|nr:hypothetical protein [Deltaproteobacteria bacterium]
MSSSYNAGLRRHKVQAAICPITMGMETSMTDAGFAKSCRMRNKGQEIRNGYGSAVGTSTIYDEYCKQCGGEYPPE